MLRIVASVGIIGLLAACAAPVPPSFQPVEGAVIAQDEPFVDGFDAAKLSFTVLLSNPNRVPVELRAFEWSLRVGDGQAVASGQLEPTLTLDDRESRVYEVDVPIDLAAIRERDFEGVHDGVPWVVELGADNHTLDSEGFGETWLEVEGHLPVPLPPKIALNSIDVLDAGDGDRAWSRVRLEVDNPNPSGNLFFQDIDWQLHINGVQVVDAAQDYLVPIPFGQGPVTAELFAEVDFGAVGGLEQFLDQQQLDAELGGTARVTHALGTPGVVSLDPGGVTPITLACASVGLYLDSDADGYGDSSSGTSGACWAPGPTSNVGGDCDDADPTLNPGANDVCDGQDVDCDGIDGNDQVLASDEICAGVTWRALAAGNADVEIISTPLTAPDDATGTALHLTVGSNGDFAALGTEDYAGTRLADIEQLSFQTIAYQRAQDAWMPRVQLYVDWDGPGANQATPGKLTFDHEASGEPVLGINAWHTLDLTGLNWFADDPPASMASTCAPYEACSWSDWIAANPDAVLLMESTGGDPGLMFYVGPPFYFWDGAIDAVTLGIDRGGSTATTVHDF